MRLSVDSCCRQFHELCNGHGIKVGWFLLDEGHGPLHAAAGCVVSLGLPMPMCTISHTCRISYDKPSKSCNLLLVFRP